ncbi:MAG: GAF domain-containing sensor histidine kinase [Actinomycetota bacterium]|nr:GAF domain-containing sensor histidine kinase [Actinomycetota bacterium]
MTTQQKLHRESAAQWLRYQTALSACARTLLSSTVDDRLEQATEALLEATQATSVFVRRNVTNSVSGLCSENALVTEYAATPSDGADGEHRDCVPWSRMPAIRRHLEAGEPFNLRLDQSSGSGGEACTASPTPATSELDVPIFVEGEWAGLIGFSDETTVREWNEQDLSLLTTVAAMIGSFWEREILEERLEQAISAKGDFLANVGHELRTPLASVLGFGQVLSEDAGTLSAEEHSELLGTIVRQAADLTNIVDDLLASAKNDTGTLHLTLVPVTLRAQAAQALEDFEQDQVGHISLAGGSARATGDPSRVRQIIRNLVSNALRYGGADVRIEVSSDADTAKVLVCDNGSAIPTADRERIFAQYQRASNVVGPAESLGLGLSISRRLAEHMGGDLTYRHDDGESIFELALPGAD